MNNNFYEYLQDLNKNIKLKIIKRKYKIKYLKQTGGANPNVGPNSDDSPVLAKPKVNLVAQLKTEVDRLKQIKDTIDMNIHLADRLGYDEAFKRLNETTIAIEKLTKELNIPREDYNLQDFINKLDTFNSTITSDTGYIKINLEKKDMFVTPLITPDFQKLPGEIIERMNDQMKSFLEKINDTDKSNNDQFRILNGEIDSTIKKIEDKNIEINKFNSVIEKKREEIHDSINDREPFTIDKECFIDNNSDIIDLINIDQLYGITIGQSEPEMETGLEESSLKKQQGEITDRIRGFNPKLIDIDINTLVIPDFESMKDKTPLMGGGIYYVIPEKLKQITINIYEYWVTKIKKLVEDEKQKKLVEEQEQERRDIEQRRFFEEQQQRIRDEYKRLKDTIKNIKSEIDKINKTYNGIGEKYKIQKEIKQEIKQINLDFTSLNESFATLLESRNIEIIYTKIQNINSDLKKIQDKILIINQSLVELKIEIKKRNNSSFQLEIVSIQEKIRILEGEIQNFNQDKINKKSIKYINELIDEISEDSNGYKILKLLTLNSYDEISTNEKTEEIKQKRINKIKDEIEKITINELKESNKITYAIKLFEFFIKICDNQEEINNHIRLREQQSWKIGERQLVKLIGSHSNLYKLSTSTSKQKIINKYDKLLKNNESIDEKRIEIRKLESGIEQRKEGYDKMNEEVDQYGGGFEEWIKYRSKLIIMQDKINYYKLEYNKFIKNIDEFNKLYIDLYYHQLYITSYIEHYLIDRNNRIYNYISRGMVDYYLDIVKRIHSHIIDKQHDPITDYLRKHHSINITIILNFLNYLFLNWADFAKIKMDNFEDKKRNNTTKLDLLHEKIKAPQLKFNIFLFNMFKDIIDTYSSVFSSPVGAYLRINDYKEKRKPENDIFVTKHNKNLQSDILDTCLRLSKGIDVKSKSSDEDIKNLGTFIENVKSMEFKNIFDPTFESNETLSLYMGIPNFLSQNRSILIITYGYSGVGKTFTIFGKPRNEGILQKSLQNIKNKKGIKVRAFEIYGVALPYKSYWNDKRPGDYNHSIFSYEYPYNIDNQYPKEYNFTTMKKYLDQIDDNFDDDNTFKTLSEIDINNFKEYIDRIDKHRRKVGRIKKTINNPESSRSIIIFEFKIKIDDKQVYFIVMDLPGKEDVKSTYVYNNNIDNPDFGIQIRDKFTRNYPKNRDGDPIRAAVFLNPMFISVFHEIAKEFIKSSIPIHSDYKILSNGHPYLKLELKDIMKSKYGDNNSNTLLNDFAKDKIKDSSESIKQNFFDSFKSAEFFKYIIDNNLLNVLIEFYNNILLDLTLEQQTQNYGALPFEAFYINETILDLIDVLSEKVNEGGVAYIKPPTKIMDDFFNINVNIRYHNKYGNIDENRRNIPNRIINESASQSYFMRELLRKELSLDSTKINTYATLQFHPYSRDEYHFTDFNPHPQSLKGWMENMYVFNKSFISHNDPPIKTFLSNYLKKVDRDDGSKKNFIDNIYLFYVVSNDNPENCVNQIKLISDSKDFLDIIKKWKY